MGLSGRGASAYCIQVTPPRRFRTCRRTRVSSPVEHTVRVDSQLARALDANKLARRLRAECRGDVLFDRAARGRYATDASIYQVFPIGIVVPRDEADAKAALAVAREEGVPLLPRGAGSSQCGQTVGEALVIDHSKALNAIGQLDLDALTISVQPGVVLDRLNRYLQPHGLWFPVDVSTSAQATIGGMAGNNSCGSRSIEYGNMVHNVLGIDAILADGSEVTFGTLDSMPRTGHAGGLGEGLAAIGLVDRTMLDLARANPAVQPIIERALVAEPEAILLVEFAGADADAQKARLTRLFELMGDLGLPGSVVAIAEPAAQRALWEVRKAGLNIMMSMKGDGKPVSFIEDCAVPLEHLADYTARLSEIFRKQGTQGTWYAHASVGTLHVRPILDMRRDGAAKMRAIAEETSAMVREYKGAYSGEHGDGLCRGEWVAWQFGPTIGNAFAEIKALFDPDNRMNPGKIVAPPKMDDATLFRFGPGYRRATLVPRLDWSTWDVDRDPVTGRESAPGTGGDDSGGLAKAVEMCNNNGHCRKFDAGTMCPSYRVTRDEQHTTRGRANTLRLALSGQLGDEDLSGDAVHAALELCVSCKGCKRECPTGVDMARLKIEALAAYRTRHALSLGERIVGDLPRYGPYISAIPTLPH